MSSTIKLSREQIFFLTFIGILGNMVYCHTWIDDATDRTAWIAVGVGILLIIPLVLLILYLGKASPGDTVFDIIEASMGKFVSKAVMVLFILINYAVVVAQLNMFTEMLKTFFLPLTPPLIIMLVLIATGALFVNSGILILSRLVEVLSLLGLINYLSTFTLAFPTKFRIEYIIPIFDSSVLGFVKGSLFITGNACELILFLMIIIAYIPEPLKHYKWVISGVAGSALVFSFAVMVIMGMLSPELAKRIAYGGVNASKLIQIGEYVGGLEVFVFGTYQFIAVGKICLCLYCILESSKKMFTSKMPVIQLAIISLLMLVASILLNSYNKAYFIAVYLGSYINLPFSIFIVLMAFISNIIKNKRAGRGLV